MLKDITLGQYYPGKSLIHRIDPRVKILALIAYLVIVFIADNFIALGFLLLTSVFIIILSKIPLKTIIKSIKPILILVLITSVINIFNIDGDVIAEFWVLSITKQGIRTAIFVSVRIILLVAVSSLLTYTTTPTKLTDGLEKLMTPLKVFRVDVHSIAMMMTIALRFIPTLIDEVQIISNAQKARGADMDSGGLLKKVKAVVPILIPLFISAFRRASDLAFAMECRCYTGVGRTHFKQLKMTSADIIATIFMLVILAAVILLNIFAGFSAI